MKIYVKRPEKETKHCRRYRKALYPISLTLLYAGQFLLAYF